LPRLGGIVVADFDNDGVLDVVVANVGSALTAYYSHGPMAWTGSTVPGSRPGNVLEAADFNQDGWTDLAVAYTSASRLSLYLGGPSGLRWSADRATGSSPRGVLAADLNQDGLVDLVTANRGSNTLSIFAGRRDAPDGFAAAVSRPAGRGSRRVAAGDFNHDGRLDLVSVNESVSDATLLLNTTTLRAAAFSFHLEQPLGPNEVGFGTPDGIEIADLDRNGRPDVVLLGGGGITIHFDGTARRTVLPIESLEMFGLGHFNRDGQLDIATLSYWNDQVQVFLGDGSGRFSSLPPQPLAKGLGLRVADLNRDGTSDLVVRRGGVLTVLYSRGDGVLEYGGDVQPPENAADVVVSDVNRDGIPDFVAGHGFPGGVSVLYGDASGSWLRTDSFATDDRGCCGQVGVGDFNEDGVPASGCSIRASPAAVSSSTRREGHDPAGQSGELHRILVPGRSDPDVQALDPRKGAERQMEQRLGLGAVRRRRRVGRTDVCDRHDLGAPVEPRGVLRLRHLRVGLGRRRVGRGEPERRHAPLPAGRAPDDPHPDAGRRRVDRSGGAVGGAVSDRTSRDGEGRYRRPGAHVLLRGAPGA
jgi:hypothetical protein